VRRLVAAARPRPDLVVLPELFANPFWCVGLADPGYFAWAEGLDGPVVTAMRELAAELGAVVVTPFFERGALAGEHYNSVAVIDRTGELVPGRLPSGQAVATYRKHAISQFRWDAAVNDEKFYFRPGQGLPTFATDVGRLGVLVCYDRWFPEAWRVLALSGAEIVCVPNASMGDVADLFLPSMRTCAAQNLVYVVATNRAGVEEVEGRKSRYYGLSCLVGPRGEVLAAAGEAEPDTSVGADLDLDRIAEVRTRQTMYRDRRPELYGLLSQPAGGEGDRRDP
jgi:N-carbamoylputrescine amidase